VSGKLVDSVTTQPDTLITVKIQSSGQSAVTDSTGAFSISNVPDGPQTLVFTNSLGGALGTKAVTITGSVDNLGTIQITGEGTPPVQPPV
jgi:hypothetical protein